MNPGKLLAQKDWAYYVYEKGSDIQLSVPIPAPVPGFDILYTLSASEKEAYLRKGIKALESRIEDMKINYTTYEMNAWR